MQRKSGLADRDVQPTSRLRDRTSDFLDLEVGGPQPEDELIQTLKGKQVLFTTSRLTVSERVLTKTNLDLVAKIGTGIDNIDLDAAVTHSIPVIHTPGLNARSVAEHTVMLALAVSHRLSENQALMQRGQWRDEVTLGTLLTEKTVGIIGFGNVGHRVATMLSGFHVKTLAYDPYVRTIKGEVTNTEMTDLDSLLKRSDIICVNAELTDETRGIINTATLEKMKDTAIIVNTARGPIVDTEALVDAIESETLAGAGLDVFETEPLPASSRLHDLENVITTPHAAAMIREYRESAIDTLVENTRTVLGGGTVPKEFVAVDPRDN
ncbi:NAD(P)-dependent oxidoreductase [Halalkalicoccus sp. GCM10025322]|uniref:NAD(P)-dependent oxidoreductase n=1 Tax=Halalkalicoccus TaxID=332246 RepID=UPI002F963584